MASQPVPSLPPARPRIAPGPGILPRPVIPKLTRFPNPIVKLGTRR